MIRSCLAVVATLSLLIGSALHAAEADFDQIRKNIEANLPGIPVGSLEETPIEGIYELVTDGQIYYINESATYLLDGSLISLQNRENLTEGRLGGLHVGLIGDIGEENMLIYEPEQESNRSITVFTDISCGYCRRLHSELDTLLEEGVRVRYLLFPRAGLGTQAHKDLESVWCADDPQAAMTNAKAGGTIEPKSCENPIESHVALAERIGLRGTPLIYLDNGERVPGYREATSLAESINGSEPIVN